MTSPQLPDHDDQIDPALGAIAAAILDGRDIDWTTASVSDSIAAFAGELRMVADIAALHRSLSDDEREPLRFPPEYPWHVGTLILTESLGRGTYGEVFRAWDNELHRDVAVKLLFGGGRRGDAAARALDEGRLLARVRHPNVMTVHGVERIDERVGLVTEYVKGQTLAQIVRESGPFSAEQTARAGIDLCHALEAVHAAGLLHRDIKAQNVMRHSSGRVVLMDFGAGLTGEAAPAMAGTPLYLAPEVLDGGAATEQSDVYSLGVLLHYLLTGGFPVGGASIAEIREAHRKGARTTLKTARPGIARPFADAVDRATDPDPARRHATAAAFADALEAAASPRRRQLRAAVIAAAVVILLIASVALWRTFKPQPVPAADAASARGSRVTLPPYYDFGGSSFDGRYLAYVGLPQHVWVLHTATGQTRRIAEARREEGAGDAVILSGDGTQAAYAWRSPDRTSELRIAAVEDRWPQAAVGSPPATTVFRTEPNATIVPLEWSRDAATVLFSVYRNDGRVELMTMSRDGARQRVLQTFTAGPLRRASISPDGRFVVYDQAAALPSPQRDVLILSADGSTPPAVLIGGGANDELPIWSADGRAVTFISDRDGSSNIWRLPVRNGAAGGRPRIIARGAHALTPLSISANGDYYYALQTKHDQIFTVPLDARGVAAGEPEALPGDAGVTRRSPVWSPDGDTLAFVTVRGMNLFDHGSFLTFAGADGRAVRQIAPQLTYFGVAPIRWSADGRELLVRGKALDGYFGFHRVDVTTGAAATMLRGQPRGREESIGNTPAWGADGKTLLFARRGAIMERNLLDGGDRVLLPAGADESVSGLDLSPRGDRLAFSKIIQVAATGATPASTVSVLAVREPDGTITELLRQTGASLVLLQWTPDGRDLLYAVVTPNRPSRLWRVAANAGATAIDIGVSVDSQRPRVSIRPDGRALTYSTGMTAFEPWVLRGIAR